VAQNYPNPFNPQTTIKYRVPEESFVTMKLFDLLGKEVALLLNQNLQPGSYDYRLNISDYNLVSGIYFYTFKAGSYSSTKKMIITK
jgi:hypothetical protein